MKRCACGLTYDARDPARRVGVLSLGGEVLLLANCDCGSTGAIVLVPHPGDVRERLDADSLLDDTEEFLSSERGYREIAAE